MKLEIENRKSHLFVDASCQHGKSRVRKYICTKWYGTKHESSSFTIECSIITIPDSCVLPIPKQTNGTLFILTLIVIGIRLISRADCDFNVENNVVEYVFELEYKLECDVLPSPISGSISCTADTILNNDSGCVESREFNNARCDLFTVSSATIPTTHAIESENELSIMYTYKQKQNTTYTMQLQHVNSMSISLSFSFDYCRPVYLFFTSQFTT